jgi:hypothetical protein
MDNPQVMWFPGQDLNQVSHKLRQVIPYPHDKLDGQIIQTLAVFCYLGFILKWWSCHCQVVHIVPCQRATQEAKLTVCWLHWMVLQGKAHTSFLQLTKSEFLFYINHAYYIARAKNQIQEFSSNQILKSRVLWDFEYSCFIAGNFFNSSECSEETLQLSTGGGAVVVVAAVVIIRWHHTTLPA